MARSAGVCFAVATPADDAAIRCLLRENPTRGAISLSFEREPAYFGSETRGCFVEDQTIVAYESGRVVCMGRCSTRPRYLNGELRRVGYLGELRLAANTRRTVEILRGGYRFFRELQGGQSADFYFTSIAADNDRARRVLEHGFAGLPRYEFLTEFVTLLISCRGGACAVPWDHRDAERSRDAAERHPSTQALMEHVNTHAAHHQLAVHATDDDLDTACALVALRDSNDCIVAAAALSDQRAWRQTVVRGYSRGLAVARPFVNLFATVSGGPRLPRVGAVVPAAFLSPLAITPGYESRLPELIRAAFAPARTRRVELLTLGFAAGDPELAIVRRHFRCREYRSRLYRVSWPGDASRSIVFDGRSFRPEVALL